jgi:hypothetical protein
MSCERFEGERIDVAAGQPPSPALQAHLEGCAACRTRLDQQRRVLADFDRVLGARLSAEPSPDFAARVRTRVGETEPRRPWRPVWMAALAAALAAAVLAGWMARRPDREVPAGPRQAATASEARPRRDTPRVAPSDAPIRSNVPAVARPRVAAARVATNPPRRGAAAKVAEPLVLVPSGEEEALRRFVANLGRGAQPAPPLLIAGTSVDGAVAPPPLLEFPAVTIAPLPDPAVSPERSQR